MSVKRIIRSGFWFYASSILNNLSGFVYWMFISAVAGPSVVGITSAIAGIVSLISGLVNLGISTGSLRFFGKSLGENDRQSLSIFFWTSSLYSFVSYSLSGLLVLSLGLSGYTFGEFTSKMFVFVGVFVLISGFSFIPDSLIVSMLRTDLKFIMTLAGNSLKLSLGLALVYMGWGWVGAVIGYMCVSIVALVVGLTFSFKKISLIPHFSLSAFKEVLKAGLASWLPNLIMILGQWLGVLAVFTVSGAIETGFYYVAYAIASVVLMIATSLMSLLFPVLSGMNDGRKRASFHVLRISLAFMLPLSFFVMAYPWLPLSLLGKSYISASLTLLVLLLSSFPLTLYSCINSLVYAYGEYTTVLGLGLATNIPRIILYYLLTPIYGGLGAALSFTLGSFAGLIASSIVAHKTAFNLDYPMLAKTTFIPASLAFLLWLFNIPWLIGLLLIPASLLLYLRLHILTKSDIKELANALWVGPIVDRFYLKHKDMIDKIIG